MRTLSPYKYVTGSSEFELPFFANENPAIVAGFREG